MSEPTDAQAQAHLEAFVEHESEGLAEPVSVRAAMDALSMFHYDADPQLLRKAIDNLLTRHERDFWQRASRIDKSTVSFLAKPIAESTTIYSQFLKAACKWLPELAQGQEPTDPQYQSFCKTARAFAKLSRYTEAPKTSAECAGVRFISKDPELVEAACEVMEARAGNPGLGAAFLFYWLITILAQSRTDKTYEVIQRTIEKATEETRRVVLQILHWYAEEPRIATAILACGNRNSCRPGPCSVPHPISDRHPSRAYRFVEGRQSRHDGWSRGRPRGISPEQWPRSKKSGVPLAHAFSLKLPQDYRVRDKTHVAIAFFYNPSLSRKEARETDWASGEDPRDMIAEHHPHPQEVRFNREGEFALIWLTESEFAGPECPLPHLGLGHAAACRQYIDFLDEDFPAEWLRLEAYADPNVGFQPVEQEDDQDEELDEQLDAKELNAPTTPSSPPPSYVSPYSERGDSQGMFDVGSHLGGTSFASRGLPPGLSAYYLELEHGFGGLDFGGEGNGQLDLLNETWAWQW